MSKIYALLGVKALLDNNNKLNINIIWALQESNIKDIWLFTDMSFSPLEVSQCKQLINSLEANHLTVLGVLTKADLFWAADSNELSQLETKMAKHQIDLNSGNVSSNQIMALENDGLIFLARAFGNMRMSPAKPGAAYLNVDVPHIMQNINGALNALNIHLVNRETNYHAKSYIFHHFLKNKPADCNGCIVFDDDEIVLKQVKKIAQDNNFPLVIFNVMQQDFHDSSFYKERYRKGMQSLLLSQSQFSSEINTNNGNTINPNMNDSWLAEDDNQLIPELYRQNRGYKFFGLSSDNSLMVLSNLKDCNLTTITKAREINRYLALAENKGKRLYDILLEYKIRFVRRITNSGEQNINWLTDDVLYLINQKYNKQRGFILFGVTCEKSKNLLKQLNSGKTLPEKQQAIEDYLNDDTCRGKRMFNILIDLRDLIISPLPRRLVLQS